MRKKEQLLWDALKRNALDEMWLQRVENVVGDGMADVLVGCSDKWVELKAPSSKKRAITPLLGKDEGLRTSQINWHLKRSFMPDAKPSYVLIRTAEGELLLLPGHLAPMINAMGIESARQCSLASSWPEIMQELK
jgi:hypothetical protein